MKKLILLMLLLLHNFENTFATSNNSMKACTVHELAYDIIPQQAICDFYRMRPLGYDPNPGQMYPGILVLDIGFISSILSQSDSDLHDRLEPHNPECFGSYPIDP